MGHHCLQAKYRELRFAASFLLIRTHAWRDMLVVWDGKTRTQGSHNFARGSEHLRDRVVSRETAHSRPVVFWFTCNPFLEADDTGVQRVYLSCIAPLSGISGVETAPMSIGFAMAQLGHQFPNQLLRFAPLHSRTNRGLFMGWLFLIWPSIRVLFLQKIELEQ